MVKKKILPFPKLLYGSPRFPKTVTWIFSFENYFIAFFSKKKKNWSADSDAREFASTAFLWKISGHKAIYRLLFYSEKCRDHVVLTLAPSWEHLGTSREPNSPWPLQVDPACRQAPLFGFLITECDLHANHIFNMDALGFNTSTDWDVFNLTRKGCLVMVLQRSCRCRLI